MGTDGLMGILYRLPQGLAAACARPLRPGTISTFFQILMNQRIVLYELNDILLSIRFGRKHKIYGGLINFSNSPVASTADVMPVSLRPPPSLPVRLTSCVPL